MWVSSDGVRGLEVLLNLDAFQAVEVVEFGAFQDANGDEGISFFSANDLILVARDHTGCFTPLARIPALNADEIGGGSMAYELAREVMADLKEIMRSGVPLLDLDVLVVTHSLAKIT